MRGIVRNAYEVVEDVVESNPTIESLTLVTYVEGLTWRDLRGTSENGSTDLLLKGLHQDRGERILTTVSRTEVSAKNLGDMSQRLRDKKLLGAASRVRLVGGRSAQIPMMDFMCTPSTSNLELLAHLLRDLRPGRGCLLESGRSYHYYGFRLLTEEEWRVFLGKCLLMTGFTDDRYVGHQLVDGYCVLRLSAGKSKGDVPTVVAELL
jgi:hypothetical protein